MAQPEGILEDVLVKEGKFIFLVNFVVIDIDEDKKIPMSVQKHSLQTRDLACLCLVMHLKNHYFVILLIFSFIYDLVGKLVQLGAY